MRVLSAFLAIAILALTIEAAPRDTASWQNVQSLATGARIELSKKSGEKITGDLRSVSPDAIVLNAKHQELSVPRSDVAKVVAKRRGHAKWIGLAIGAGAGAGAGAALGARLANESAGDIDFKAAGTAGVAAAGALIGFSIGAALDSRHSTLYIAP